MARPGTQINIRETPPARSAPTDTGVWFIAGLTEKGPLTPVLVQGLSDYERVFGSRVSYGLLYDALDAYFHEGGSQAYVSRVVGPAPIVASRNLMDAGAAVSLVVRALGPGDYANDIDVAVVAGSVGGSFVLVVREAGIEVDRSPDLVDQAAAVSWAQQSDYITIALGASANDPQVAAAALLTLGADDRANVTETQWDEALDRFTKDLGPGQVSMPGRTTATAHANLLQHGVDANRRALIDLADSASKTTLMAAAAAARTLNAHVGAAFAPWAVIPGLTAGTTRTVPYSAVEAGIIARNDVEFSSNIAAAGDNGQALYVSGLSQNAWSDADREDLNEGGVNVARVMFGGVRTYGYRTLVDPIVRPNWVSFGGSRLVMEIQALADEVLEHYVFEEVDGFGHTFGQLDGELTGMVAFFHATGSLYGASPSEAFYVDTGPAINTPETIAAQEIHAQIAIKISPFGEFVVLDLIKVPVNQPVV